MVKKMQSYFSVVVILFFIVGVIYFIYSLIAGLFEEKKTFTLENIKEYMVEENLVMSYTTFNTIEKCASNLYEAILNEEYDGIYAIVSDNTKDTYSKEEIITTLKNYGKNILGVHDLLNGHSFELEKAYIIRDAATSSYIAQIASTYSEERLNIIFNLQDATYTIDLIM